MVFKFPLNLQRWLMSQLFPFPLINPKTCRYVKRTKAEHFNIMKQPNVQKKETHYHTTHGDLRDHLTKPPHFRNK